MTSNDSIDKTAGHIKELIDQLFDIESEINQKKGIPESLGVSLWNEYTDVRKYVWLDGDHVVIIGRSSTFYRIFLDQLGQRTCIYHLSEIDDDNFKLQVLRSGSWIERFEQYVKNLQVRLDNMNIDPTTANNAFKPIDF
ncbi:hypothetical protein GCM10023206_06000 [Acinetobacter puyangensis]|uniref:Uncharacterized protein n=1 Tax=Acinetobacter puyangensis TaxID=1096779 RepID=A0A240EAT1_9GAMM|nr:hypothetical protein [Acinetobacter puyangensis]SNX45817.1 hypothetical protein SAMN05421731_10652 [Acinetobacter puyangensis]